MLVGGIAVNFYGYRRSTGDMDLFVNPTEKNHAKLKRVHAEFGMHIGEMEHLSNFLDTSNYDVYTFGISPVQIVIMTSCKGVDFDTAYTSVMTANIDPDFQIKVIHLDQLIIAKEASGRTRDKADIEELSKIKNRGAN